MKNARFMALFLAILMVAVLLPRAPLSAQTTAQLSDQVRTLLLQLLTFVQTLQKLQIQNSIKLSSPTLATSTVKAAPIDSIPKLGGGGSCNVPDASTKPFGGNHEGVKMICNCHGHNGGYVIQVGSPRGGKFHIKPESRICEFDEPKTANWVLGNYFPGRGNECFYESGTHCNMYTNDGVVQMMGTSH